MVAALLACAAPASAATYDFSFSNENGAVAGTVSGTIELADGDGVFAASSVLVGTFPVSIGYDAGSVDYVINPSSPPLNNSFTVSGGQLTSANFFGLFNGSTAISLSGAFGGGTIFLDVFNGANFGATGILDTNSTTLAFSPAVSAVPLPASLPLLLAAIGGAGLVRHRKK